MDCPWCFEPDSHHVILGNAVDVNVWHLVWCGKGVILKPSDAGIDWDLPVELAPIRTKAHLVGRWPGQRKADIQLPGRDHKGKFISSP